MRPLRVWPWKSRATALVAGAAIILALLMGALVLRRPSAGSAPSALQSAVIQAGPFASTLGLTGVVTPGDVAGVTAPFDGRVSKVGFDFGAEVVQGQMLVTLDTSEIQRRRDEAEAEYLKAAQSAADMARWSTGPEVSQARRAESSATFDMADTQRKIAQTKALLDRGLVARDEYDGLLQQQRSQEQALAAAHQELGEALRKGDAANRRVTAIELQSARARLTEADTERAGAVVRAPVAGILVRPPGEKGEANVSPLHIGMTLSKGQLIGAIAHPGGLAVTFQLSEADANRVRPGQHVQVTGPGFEGLTLSGNVAEVAGEATAAAGGDGAGVTFAARARLDPLTPAQAAIVRIGMSASVSIDIYRNPSALVAPPGAILGAAPDTFVMVRDKRSGKLRRIAVRIGQVAPAGVEVLSGLRPGDVVVWSAHASDSDSD